MKRQSTEWEQIFAIDMSDKGLISKNNPIKKWAEETELTFFQRRHTDGQWAMKRCSSITSRKMQIKNKKQYHLMTVRMTVIKKTRNNKCWRGCGGYTVAGNVN